MSTGDLIDAHSGPICVQQNSKRTFECTVRQARPGVWSIEWLIDDSKEEAGSRTETAVEGGLVDVSSRFSVSNRQTGDLIRSLTCQATGPEAKVLRIAVKFQSCFGKS